MTAPNWRTEAACAGIVPWPFCARTMGAIPEDGDDRIDGVLPTRYRAVEVPDLSDPDVLAAFDRRLALRLGAPVGDTVAVAHSGHYLRVYAGPVCDVDGNIVRWRWSHHLLVDNDPLLARVRAWASVTT